MPGLSYPIVGYLFKSRDEQISRRRAMDISGHPKGKETCTTNGQDIFVTLEYPLSQGPKVRLQVEVVSVEPAARHYAIRSLISIPRCAIKTSNPLKEFSDLIDGQKESFVGSCFFNKHISKSNQRDSEKLNLDSKCAQYGQKASIHELSIYKSS